MVTVDGQTRTALSSRPDRIARDREDEKFGVLFTIRDPRSAVRKAGVAGTPYS
jgi:hypothetical protein